MRGFAFRPGPGFFPVAFGRHFEYFTTVMNPAAYERHYRAGQRFLRLHQTERAIRAFTACVDCAEEAPASERARSLYWLGISLYRAGQRSLAVRCWQQARCLSARLPVRRIHERLVNEYGMPRCACTELDDWQAFRSIQLARFLEARPSGRFTSRAERDAVEGLLLTAYKPLALSRRLERMSTDAKRALFSAANPLAPLFSGLARPASRANSPRNRVSSREGNVITVLFGR